MQQYQLDITKVADRYNSATAHFIARADEIGHYYHPLCEDVVNDLFKDFYSDVVKRLQIEKNHTDDTKPYSTIIMKISPEEIIAAILSKFIGICSLQERELTFQKKKCAKILDGHLLSFLTKNKVDVKHRLAHFSRTNMPTSLPVLILKADLFKSFKYIMENYSISLKLHNLYQELCKKVEHINLLKNEYDEETIEFSRFISEVFIPDDSKLICEIYKKNKVI